MPLCAVLALARRAREADCWALALTDTNNLHGVVEHIDACREAGVKPIVGCRVIHQKTKQRATVLCATPEGWGSLCRVVTRVHSRPKVELATTLKENSHGLIVLASNLNLLGTIKPAYGNRLYLEIVRPGFDEATVRQLCDDARKKLGVKPVASLGVHFATEARASVGRLLAAVRQGGTVDGNALQVFGEPGNSLADAIEVEDRFRDLTEALVNADLIAESCRADVLPNEFVPLPCSVPEGQDAFGYLSLLCETGLTTRGLGADQAARERLDAELQVALARGVATLFLFAREVAAVARKLGAALSCRGSAASSLICYLLDITSVNPMAFGLRPERFLHPDESGEDPFASAALAAQGSLRRGRHGGSVCGGMETPFPGGERRAGRTLQAHLARNRCRHLADK
jgi:DNA polymerase III alpha subunit